MFDLMRRTDSRAALDTYHRLFLSAVFFLIGFSPITALAISIVGLLPLSAAAVLLVGPAIVAGVVLSLRDPACGKRSLKGLAVGLCAVFLYDCMRVPFIMEGVWGDFIPKIGGWLLNSPHPNWAIGYLYRYLGDGAGMGLAFTVAHDLLWPGVPCRRAALAYGVAIWLCLIATLVIAPHGQAMLFALTPTTLILSLCGHLIYGTVIGLLLSPRRAAGLRRSVTAPYALHH
jgi:hypothetical protein